MTILAYLKEKSVFCSINVILWFLISVILLEINVSPTVVTMMSMAWFIPLMLSYTLDFLKKRAFYLSLRKNHDALDKKYLLPELIKEPHFLEGKLVFDVLAGANKQMHEHVNFHKREQLAYREYIETWVHEIKTPISSAKLTLENKREDQGLQEELKNIEELVEQVLYYARSSDVSKDYIIREFPIKDAVNKAIQRNAKEFIYKKIKLHMADMDEIVYSDMKWLEFILNQLIVNAIKYCVKEKSEMNIYTKVHNNNIVLNIQDNGVGIDERDLSRVFEKGFTGENGRVYRRSTGIGLYLCKKLADKLHIGLRIDSEKGRGTTVQLIFPKSKLLLLES